jgi:hypothetical protein
MNAEMQKNYGLQCALDDLDLVGLNLFDALDYLQRFTHIYKIEWATRAKQVIEPFDKYRIRVWYRDETQAVIAIMHG